jgi:hypothetical protein
METQALRDMLHQLIATIHQAEMTPDQDTLPAEMRKSNERYHVALKKKLAELQESYTEKRLKLARLKRQIARGSHRIDRPGTENPDLTEMSHRLHTLEAKVDRILEVLSSKVPR